MSAPVTTGTASAAQAAAAAAAQFDANQQYMATTIDKYAACPPVGSTGLTAAFSPGQTLLFNVPVANNGFLRALRFTCAMTVNYTAAGAGPYINLTASAPYSLFSEMTVNFNGYLVRTHPYIAAVALPRTKKFNSWQYINQVPNSGYVDAQVQANLRSSAFGIAAGANAWLFTMEIPLNVLNDLNPIGMLPIMGTSNTVQVGLTCNPQVTGADPLLNAIYTNATTLTVTGNVTCDAVYRDGTTMWGPAKMSLNLLNLPTVQWLIDQRVTNLQNTVVTRGQLKTMLRHFYWFSIIIDGNQNTAFALSNNITSMELDPDATGSNPIFRVGGSTNVSMNEWFIRMRRALGMDMDPGVIPWVVAPVFNQSDTDNQLGNQILNAMPDGWTSIYHGYQLNSVGGMAGITPRVESFLISANPAGLVGV